MRLVRVDDAVAAPGAPIGAANFFEPAPAPRGGEPDAVSVALEVMVADIAAANDVGAGPWRDPVSDAS